MSIIDLSKEDMYARMVIAEAQVQALEQAERRREKNGYNHAPNNFTNQELIEIIRSDYMNYDILKKAQKELERRLTPNTLPSASPLSGQ